MSQSLCFHCHEAIPKGLDITLTHQTHTHAFCCEGCKAVCHAIYEQGLEDYYTYRSENAERVYPLVPEQLDALVLYDEPAVLAEISEHQGEMRQIALSVEGMTCAACAWLIEKKLLANKGVKRIDVNATSHRAHITWDDSQIKLSSLLKQLAELGFKSYPFQEDASNAYNQQKAKGFLRRLGVAGLMTMQVMMFAFAMYFGMFADMEADFEAYFRVISMALATPVILYSALPFLTSAITALKARYLNMDLPVSLAIFGAYFASCYATFTHTGEVYFESITMFTFLLLLGKYLEFRARLKAAESTANLHKLQPFTATLINTDGSHQVVSAKALSKGDRILVRAGETIPADAKVVNGVSSTDESMITGEHEAVEKHTGSQIFAGSINHDGVLEAQINRIGQDTLLNQIIRLQKEALDNKPKIAMLTDRIAQWFVAGLLLFASITAIAWYHVDPSQAFWVTIAVLVATCPCALSLAIPTALTCSVGRLSSQGLLIKKGHVLETMAGITDVCFDKTGTLTLGKFTITEQTTLSHEYAEELLDGLAYAIEQHSEHPIAKAFTVKPDQNCAVTDVKVVAGFGITGRFKKHTVAMGKNHWFASAGGNPHVVLYIDGAPVRSYVLADEIRPGAKNVIAQLKAQGITAHMITGDHLDAAQKVADALGIEHIKAGQLPEDKLEYVKGLQAQHKVVAMLGDGINDSPVFNAAHVSLAMEAGADMSKNTADVVILNDTLPHLNFLHKMACQTKRIIKQNLTISLCYNLTILPLAALGWVAPWMAVIGMSASSIVVITNSLRLARSDQ